MKKIMLFAFAFIMAFLTIQAVFAGGDPVGGGGGGACCPSLYVYDGSDYQFSGVLGLESSESVQFYTLNVTPVAVNGFYNVYLVETESVSYIDQIKLVVDDTVSLPCLGDDLLKHSDNNFLTLESGVVEIAFPAVPGGSFVIQIEGFYS